MDHTTRLCLSALHPPSPTDLHLSTLLDRHCAPTRATRAEGILALSTTRTWDHPRPVQSRPVQVGRQIDLPRPLSGRRPSNSPCPLCLGPKPFFLPIFCLLSLTRILLRSGNSGSHSPGKVPPHPILYCTVHSSFSALRTPSLSPFSLPTYPWTPPPVLAQKSRFRKPEAAGSRRPPPQVSFVLVSCPRSALGVWSVVFLPWLSCPIVSFFRVYSIE